MKSHTDAGKGTRRVMHTLQGAGQRGTLARSRRSPGPSLAGRVGTRERARAGGGARRRRGFSNVVKRASPALMKYFGKKTQKPKTLMIFLGFGVHFPKNFAKLFRFP